MQLFADSSEEGNFVKGLSLIPGKVLDLKKNRFENTSYRLEFNKSYARE